MRHSGGFHSDGLVGPSGDVEADPLCDDTLGVLMGFKAMTMHVLLCQRRDEPFDQAVLLRVSNTAWRR